MDPTYIHEVTTNYSFLCVTYELVYKKKKTPRIENARCIPNNGMFRGLKYNQA